MNVPWDINSVGLTASKHFSLKYMRAWRWDYHDVRDAIRDAYRIEKVGKNKYEIYVQKKGFKKVISAYYREENELFCITGSEGGTRT